MTSDDSRSGLFMRSVKTVLIILFVLWSIFILQYLLDFPTYQYGGLFPRSVDGLKGILFSPLLHGSFMHLISNSAPLTVLTVMILYFYNKVAFESIVWLYLMTGVMVWLFARPVYHIGASGVVYAMVSFVFWAGIFVRNIRSIVLSLIVAVLYSGMFLGVLPNEDGISWESHLLGGVVGIFVAYILREKIKKHDPPVDPVWEEEEKKFFLDRDIFDRKKDSYWK